jgi:hypothetical protein
VTNSGILRMCICALSLAAVAVFSSCGSDTCEPVGGEPDLSRGTPDSLLNLLAKSFSNREIDWYDACLTDDFVFGLTADIAESLGLSPSEPWLTRSRDVAAVGRMFRDECVEEVDFSFISVDAWVEVEDGTLFSRVQPEILVTVMCPGSEPLTYMVNESWLDVTVVEDPADKQLWLIRSMEEMLMNPGCAGSRPDTYLATGLTSLSQLKSLFLTASNGARTPEEAIEAYAASIEARDIEPYGDCLDFEHRFVFTEDVAESLRLPRDAPWWDKQQDLVAMTAMFSDPVVTLIEFDYVVVSRDTSWVKSGMIIDARVLPDILVVIECPGEVPIWYVPDDVWLDFRLVRRGPCCCRWTVREVEEVMMLPRADAGTSGLAPASSYCTYSSIKAMFAP